jgi:hypothetical protein
MVASSPIKEQNYKQMKKQEKSGHNTDKALAKAGSVIPPKNKKLQTEEPIAEKDEEKLAEEEQRKRMRGENS